MAARRRRPRTEPKRRWRDYETSAAQRPVKRFIDELGDYDAAAIVAAMHEIQQGIGAAKHLRGAIFEVVADGQADVKMSTLERYAAAVGKRVKWQLVDAN
jgi:hypothetical protein